MNINKLKPYLLKATIEGGGENKKDLKHKEDSREDFQYDFTENQTKLKTIVNKKNQLLTSENWYT